MDNGLSPGGRRGGKAADYSAVDEEVALEGPGGWLVSLICETYMYLWDGVSLVMLGHSPVLHNIPVVSSVCTGDEGSSKSRRRRGELHFSINCSSVAVLWDPRFSASESYQETKRSVARAIVYIYIYTWMHTRVCRCSSMQEPRDLHSIIRKVTFGRAPPMGGRGSCSTRYCTADDMDRVIGMMDRDDSVQRLSWGRCAGRRDFGDRGVLICNQASSASTKEVAGNISLSFGKYLLFIEIDLEI